MPDLSPAERKVAQLVIADPEVAMGGTLAHVARRAGVSEPTVVRFCRSLGLEGIGDLRLALARTDQRPRMHRRVEADTPVSQVASAVLGTAIAALEALQKTLDPVSIERAAPALVRASRVEIWGFGASAAVAQDLAHKLFRVCRGVVARSDPHMQAMAAATLDGDAVALCISHTGRSRELIEAARLARQAGATVLSLTRPGSPLADASTLIVPVEVEENTELHTPMVSRLAHLVMGDALAVAVALLSPPAADERLARMKAALKPRRTE
jgi:RpiR family carbohydrate utilization transcriptional regulator